MHKPLKKGYGVTGRGHVLLSDPAVPEELKVVLELGLDLNVSIKRMIQLVGLNYSTMFTHRYTGTLDGYMQKIDQVRLKRLHDVFTDMQHNRIIGLRRSTADNITLLLFETYTNWRRDIDSLAKQIAEQ